VGGFDIHPIITGFPQRVLNIEFMAQTNVIYPDGTVDKLRLPQTPVEGDA
jgi:hypothetical protein